MNLYKKIVLTVAVILSFQESQSQDIGSFFTGDWHKISFKLQVKPSFELSKYKTLIIAEVAGRKGYSSDDGDNVYDKISAQISTISEIQLLDRKKTKQILKEFKIQRSGQVEEDFVTPFGKFYSSGIIMTGRVLSANYDSEIVTSSGTLVNSQKRYYRRGTQSISFSFQFIDIKTSEIVYSKTLDVKKVNSTERGLGTPPKLDQNEVYISALNELAIQFKNLFMLHDKSYKVELQKHSKFNKILKKAAALIELSEFEMAREMLIAIPDIAKVKKSDKALSKAYYNIAILDYYTGELVTAKTFAKKGFLKDSNNEKCLKLFKLLNQ